MFREATAVLVTEAYLREILAWLKQEERETGEGFYCNREIIVEAQKQGEVWCVIANARVVGFVVQTQKTVGASIDILEVKPQCRRQGFGKILAIDTIERLFKSEAEFIAVRCAPRSSVPFWESLGFQATETQQRSARDDPRLILQRESNYVFNRTQ